MSEEKVKELGVKPMATGGALLAAWSFHHGRSPVAAVNKLMGKIDMKVSEGPHRANEAFAAQSLLSAMTSIRYRPS